MKFKVGDVVLKERGLWTDSKATVTAVNERGNIQVEFEKFGPLSVGDPNEWWHYQYFRKLTKLERELE